ncbi:MAG TPA: IS701 family transposase [Ktedonobacterales bacterium]
MTTADQSEAPYASELQVLSRATLALDEVQERIGPHVRRAEVRHRVRRFLEGLLAPIERKNGWQLAEALGEQGPHGVQRLLYEADWDQEAVRDELRAYVLAHLGEEAGILVVDETGFLKKGKKSAGVARQYSGTAGRRENSQIGVFLLYAGGKGAAFLDRELYLPEEWTADPVRCREAGIPASVGFATKGELARAMLARAFAAGVRAAWVVGDTIYGSDDLRTWLEREHQPYVLAVAETHPVWSAGRAQLVGLVAALLPQEAWTPLSAGEGSQGPRLYDWAWLEVDTESEVRQGWRSRILIRRSLSDPSKRAYYRVWGPPEITLAELVRIAGRRWTIEEGLEEAKGEAGLDHYEVRTWRGWYRHITLALLAHAVLVVLRAQAQEDQEKGAKMTTESG